MKYFILYKNYVIKLLILPINFFLKILNFVQLALLYKNIYSLNNKHLYFCNFIHNTKLISNQNWIFRIFFLYKIFFTFLFFLFLFFNYINDYII